MQHTYFVLCMRHPSWRSQLSETTSSYLKFQKHVEKQWFQWSHHATAKKKDLGCWYSYWKYIDSIDPKHRTMRDEWCNQCESKPVSQLCDTTSSYLKFKKHVGKQWFPWPHHATPKKNTLCLLFQLEIHQFNWSQASHHVKRMMQPARVKTAKTIAIPSFFVYCL